MFEFEEFRVASEGKEGNADVCACVGREVWLRPNTGTSLFDVALGVMTGLFGSSLSFSDCGDMDDEEGVRLVWGFVPWIIVAGDDA